MVALPLTLLFLPADYFDYGTSICPSKIFMDKDCPGCGLTRGVQHAIHFEFTTAWQFNKLTFLIIPFLIFYWIHLFLWAGYDYDLQGRVKIFLRKKVEKPN